MNNLVNISVIEFLTERFPNELTAEAFFIEKRWNGKIICPYCSCDTIYKVAGSQPYKCAVCRRKFTAKTGTIMENSHIPIRTWLLAMYLMGTARKGISSIELAHQLNVTQKTAWFMAHRIREACTETAKLKGIVEIDETYVGGKEKNRHAKDRKRIGRGVADKIIVAGMRERGGKTIGRVIPNTSRYEILKLIKDNIAPEAVLMTDDHPSYFKATRIRRYKHYSVNHSARQYVNGINHTNGIESVWALLKRGLYGTYHKVSRKHLERYVSEFCFRLNNGGALPFIEAVCVQANGNALQYKRLIK